MSSPGPQASTEEAERSRTVDRVADGEPLAAASSVSVDARGLALAILAGLALIFALSWAEDFLVPLLFGIVVAYTLNPLVAALEAIRIPRTLGTLLVMATVIGALGLGTYSLRGQVQTIIERLPAAATKVADQVERIQLKQLKNVRLMQNAASQLEKAAEATTPIASDKAVTHVVVDQPTFKLSEFLWGSSIGAIVAVSQAAMVVFLVFFLLIGGDTFKRKIVRLAGPSLSKRKLTVQIFDDINGSIQKYMLMLVATNLLVGLLSWIAFAWIGLENAGAWALTAALLHLVPYLGPAVTAIATGTIAFMQFDSPGMALLVTGASLTVATLVGTFVTTWMTGRIAKMNSAAVFISLLFWGWLWGIWGLLLSIPIIVIVKVITEHVEQLRPVGELLGD